MLALVAIAVVAWYLSYRARRRRLEPMSDALLPVLADVLDETIDDLRAEADPRRAVIAAYARMERALAAYGLPRTRPRRRTSTCSGSSPTSTSAAAPPRA